MSEERGKRAPFVVEWRDGFTINIPSVDEQHKHLFELVKALSTKTVEATIDELLDYVVVHFTHEQELMEASGYPGFADHLKLHEDFGSTVADFLGRSDEWSDERVHELRRFLNKWLIGHILTHDLRFGNWYRHNQGATAWTSAAPTKGPADRKPGWFNRLFARR